MGDISRQINKCLRDLNVLHDLISNEHWTEWDIDWELNQVEKAKIPLEILKESEKNANNTAQY